MLVGGPLAPKSEQRLPAAIRSHLLKLWEHQTGAGGRQLAQREHQSYHATAGPPGVIVAPCLNSIRRVIAAPRTAKSRRTHCAICQVCINPTSAPNVDRAVKHVGKALFQRAIQWLTPVCLQRLLLRPQQLRPQQHRQKVTPFFSCTTPAH